MAKKILIIDDEVSVVDILKMRMELLGYNVITASNGQEGLCLAKETKPDLIILDLMLPKIDGYKVCGLLKQDTRFKGIPIIMFTARARNSDAEIGKEVGANAYITKSSDSKELIEKVGELLS